MHKFICFTGLIFTLCNCAPQQKISSKYPDCTSTDISRMDICLLGMTLRQAIDKLRIDSSQFHVIEEPIAMLRGISFRPNDSSEIKLYVQKELIKNKTNSLEFSKRYLFIIDKAITAVSWTKDAGANYKTVRASQK